jgi:hypothetical protein
MENIGSFRRFFLSGGQLGKPLAACADESVTFYVACATCSYVKSSTIAAAAIKHPISFSWATYCITTL